MSESRVLRIDADRPQSPARGDETTAAPQSPRDKQTIKCVVWDLDNTLWDGVLLEDQEVFLREPVVEIIKALDSRGILHSIASKNDQAKAMEKLRDFGLQEFFLYPQINWNSKVSSITKIAAAINIGPEAMAFIDDQQFERDEINFSLPQVLCIDGRSLDHLLELPQMNPRFVTEDSRMRRLMYLNEIERARVEDEFVGAQEEFLASLKMHMTIAAAQEGDLQRAEELTVRTNQLNTTGYRYSYDELNYFRQSEHHRLLIAGLRDKYGSYGKIGLALIEHEPEFWTIKLLLMSCRVMSRGVGTVLLNHIMRRAREAKVILRADFVPTPRNRMMYMTYKFAAFKEVERNGECIVMETDLSQIQSFPAYMKIEFVK
jgi:FkbH-like protein